MRKKHTNMYQGKRDKINFNIYIKNTNIVDYFITDV